MSRLDTGTRPPRAFAALVGVTSLAIVLQAITAGVFVNQDGRDGWVTVHGVIADVTWVTALITAAYALRRMRRTHPRLTWSAVALFVLLLAQTGIGHLITDKGIDGLIVVHVPLAMVVFGLAVWLSVSAVHVRRGATAPDPYGDEAAASQRFPVSNRA